MKKSSLTIVGNRYPGKVIRPATYQFSKRERMYIGSEIDAIRSHELVVLSIPEHSRAINPPEVRGLATRFARLERPEDINRFAGECGLLGLLWAPIAPDENPHDFPVYGTPLWEPLSFWQYHIKNVRRLMLLYQALSRWKRGYDVEIDGKLLNVKCFENEILRLNFLQWYDGEPTGIQLGDIEEDNTSAHLPAAFGGSFADTINLERLDEYSLAALVLAVYLRQYLHGGINLDFSRIIPAKDALLGFRFEETRSTPYLLAAIYYDLWELITDNRSVIRCEYCGLPLEKIGRRRFCDNACKQAAYRKRHNKKGFG